jgi:hypothetical protein
VPRGAPSQVGPSRVGYRTAEGDLFRGATQDPTVPVLSQLDEDAVTIGGSSSTSSSSSWSWGSGNLERGRRATMAVFERVGEALGVRRGSHSTVSDTDASDHERHSQGSTVRRRKRSKPRILTRTLSRSTVDTVERPKRQYLPKRREFMLLLPPDGAKRGPQPSVSTKSSPSSGLTAVSVASERIITTPSLLDVLERIRLSRLASGMMSADTPSQSSDHIPRRGGSAPGHRRSNRANPSFLPPPVPGRLPKLRSQTRVQALKSSEDLPVRPKSVSDLMGLAKPYSSTSSITLKQIDETPPHKPLSELADRKGKGRAKQCWWLDVSCPTWEDLRDIGEVSVIRRRHLRLASRLAPAHPRRRLAARPSGEARHV